MSLYVNNLVPGITHGGDDNNYGSSACYDVLALQVSRRPLLLAHLCQPLPKRGMVTCIRKYARKLLCLSCPALIEMSAPRALSAE